MGTAGEEGAQETSIVVVVTQPWELRSILINAYLTSGPGAYVTPTFTSSVPSNLAVPARTRQGGTGLGCP